MKKRRGRNLNINIKIEKKTINLKKNLKKRHQMLGAVWDLILFLFTIKVDDMSSTKLFLKKIFKRVV